jgi:pimeloyl-ACP methyl ester carboxylesterase
MPGSGSDEVFVAAAFTRPLGALGLRLVAPRPAPGASVVAGYLEAFDTALESDPEPDPRSGAEPGAGVIVGGVSLGAQVAVCWAADRAARGLRGPAGLLLALPAWTGEPGDAPAAVAARATSEALRRDGLVATVADARANTPEWLGAELARAWTRHGDALAESFETTARTPGPTREQLAGLRVPVGLVGLLDDPVHPIDVARHWQALLPRAALVTTTLTAMGRDPETLGRAAALAWSRAVLT